MRKLARRMSLLTAAGTGALFLFAGGPLCTAAAREGKARSAAAVNRELGKRLKTGGMAWQFHAHYAGIYDGFAKKLLAGVKPKTPKSTAEKMLRLARYFESLRDTLEAMGEQRKIVDGIDLDNTTVPDAERKSVRRRAEGEYKRLLYQVGRLLVNPPGK